MRILIAEDDYASRRILAAMLEKSGHNVLETSNGLEAWEELQKADSPCMALLDWMMPEMDGLELVRRIREREQDMSRTLPGGLTRIYIIMLTAKIEKEDMIKGLHNGADDYLTKPFHMGVLKARVDVGQRMIGLQELLLEQIRELRQSQEHIKTLQGILPICMHCKNIRNDSGYWEQIEQYVSQHTEAMFSHGICPDCMQKHYGTFLQEEK